MIYDLLNNISFEEEMSLCFLLLIWLVNVEAQRSNIVNFTERTPRLFGIKPAGEGVVTIPANKLSSILLFGVRLNNSKVTFTTKSKQAGDDCSSLDHTDVYLPRRVADGVSIVDVSLSDIGGNNYFVCVQGEGIEWWHQGNDSFVQIGTKASLLPIWGHVLMILTLLSFSGLFSGLNLGLMSLDKNDLQVIARCGTEQEKRFARAIAPVRKRGNYLLCSILLGNVFVNSTLTIFMDELTSGLVAIISSTLAIVIFGEILPQAACSRHGLAVGAKTIGFTYVFMLLTFPLSYPISKMLDFILGDEIGHVYDRERLMEYIKVTKTYNKLEEDEVNIIAGALNLKNKTVGEVMTRLEDVFMLPLTATLDFNTVSEISKRGYSRIPVYEGDRKNIVALLHAKDLAFVDPDDNKPLKTHVEFYRHQLVHTYEDESLFNLLNDMRLGKSHMAFVRKIFATEDEDPYYELTGVVTLEDIIEEILQMEIVDETDTLIDNRKKQRRKGTDHQDFTDFARIGATVTEGTHNISSQLALATFQYLSTAVEPFKKPLISETVLRRLIAQKLYYFIKNVKGTDTADIREKTLYTAGKAADYFIMLLDGKAQVTVGTENLVFDAGPFAYFGTAALRLTANDLKNAARPPTPDSPRDSPSSLAPLAIGVTTSSDAPSIPPLADVVNFVPDYTVTIVEPSLYMKVPRNVYLAAFKASTMEQLKQFSQDEERLMNEIDTVFNNSLCRTESRQMGSLQQLNAQLRERAKAKHSSTQSLANFVKKRDPSPPPTQASPARRKSTSTGIRPPPIALSFTRSSGFSPPQEHKPFGQGEGSGLNTPKSSFQPKPKPASNSQRVAFTKQRSPSPSSRASKFNIPSSQAKIKSDRESSSPPSSPQERSRLLDKRRRSNA